MKPTRIPNLALALVLVLAAFVVISCSKSGSPTAPGGGGGGGSTNGGTSFNLGPFARSQSAEVVFPGEGAFGYHCNAHRNMGMVGTVQVDAGGADSALVQMSANGFSFVPSTAHIKPGGYVRWVNASTLTNHTVTSD